MLHLPTVGKGHIHDVLQSGKKKIFDSSWCSGSHVTSSWEKCSSTSLRIDSLNVPLAEPKDYGCPDLACKKGVVRCGISSSRYTGPNHIYKSAEMKTCHDTAACDGCDTILGIFWCQGLAKALRSVRRNILQDRGKADVISVLPIRALSSLPRII